MLKTKECCRGCYNDLYNRTDCDCWSYENAKIVWRICVGVWQEPPYNWSGAKQEVLSCYHQTGVVFLPKSDSRVAL